MSFIKNIFIDVVWRPLEKVDFGEDLIQHREWEKCCEQILTKWNKY